MVGDAESAREVMHDAMLRLIERIGQFRGDAPFWGWLRQIVVNEALMRLRRERGAAFEEFDERDEPAGDGPPPWMLADAAQLERALGELPPMTRSVLWLYHVEEYTHQEIAEMTGKSVSFSKSQVARGGKSPAPPAGHARQGGGAMSGRDDLNDRPIRCRARGGAARAARSGADAGSVARSRAHARATAAAPAGATRCRSRSRPASRSRSCCRS